MLSRQAHWATALQRCLTLKPEGCDSFRTFIFCLFDFALVFTVCRFITMVLQLMYGPLVCSRTYVSVAAIPLTLLVRMRIVSLHNVLAWAMCFQ